MRVTITKTLAGVLDGYMLGGFKLGLVYNVHESFAHQLISMGAARREPDTTPITESFADPDAPDETHLIGGITVIPPKDDASTRSR